MLGLSFVSVNRWENGHAIAGEICLVLLEQLSTVLGIHPANIVMQRIRQVSANLPSEQRHLLKGTILREMYWLEWEPPEPEKAKGADDTIE